MKALAWHERDLVLDGVDEQLTRIDPSAQLSVWIIFDDGHSVVAGQLDQTFAAFEAHRTSGRILERGDGVNELDALLSDAARQQALDVVNVHAVVVHADDRVARLVLVEGL